MSKMCTPIKRLIVANWKMNPETMKEAEMIARASVKA